ncbi:MAG: acylphosphatase [Lachnospiraceae bacterium]|nr:acylphosphatase [Lachnospiraceae bacterium]
MMERIRRRYRFYGYVQGVGFRWRARQAANLYGCTGWVHNEWDGSVTMEIQGDESRIDQVIRSIRDGRYIEISSMEVEQIQVKEERAQIPCR